MVDGGKRSGTVHTICAVEETSAKSAEKMRRAHLTCPAEPYSYRRWNTTYQSRPRAARRLSPSIERRSPRTFPLARGSKIEVEIERRASRDPIEGGQWGELRSGFGEQATTATKR
jgi:hypothetical protein